ncbi:complement decay-accelerating factor, GPI-anchored [Syngnathus typhle]|uniref:complement decay-accelerating factor, GPI-anchored n=1 Tax=Syngnathus typhle TaxID=161592 RepID=UPI002A6B7415|nr:complement decay-accelerating factor, GPI-anchored [Syngnathus typhle]
MTEMETFGIKVANMGFFFLLGSSTGLKFTSLLCFYCLVWSSEANCPTPQRGENSVLSDQARLMNKYPEGSNVTLECCNGFEKESGSEVIRCLNGNWTRIELICKRMDCGEPKPQPNMIFDTSTGTLFGDIIKVTCEKGYDISGTSYKQCYERGWFGRSKCDILTCNKPAEVSNGTHSWDSQDRPTYGQMIVYNCDEGYTLVGNDSIQCDDTGKYDSPPPECKDVSSSLAPSTTAAAAHRDIIIRGGTEVTTQREKHGVVTDANKDVDYLPVILSVVCVSLVACIGVLSLHRCLLRRKGSYDTREDQKSEFLIFQNI